MSYRRDMDDEAFTLDAEFAVSGASAICSYCRHYRPGEGRTCAAFPVEDSIPLAIWQGTYDHRQPYEGDQGVLFEPVNDHCAAEVTKHFAVPVPA